MATVICGISYLCCLAKDNGTLSIKWLLRKQVQTQGKWREEHQEGCDHIWIGNQAEALGRGGSADRIRAADKEKEHLLKCVLLKAIKRGQDELCLWGIGLKIWL